MRNHFTADLHLDHENVLEMSGRLFPNIQAHDDHMIAQLNKFVPYGDRLFILGDVAWFSVENFLDRLLCKDVHLIWGNHDRNNFGKKFKTAEDVSIVKIGQKPNQHSVFMSHYPHAYWPSSHHGAFHLYGHCHRQREATLDAVFPGRRAMDVGVDNSLFIFGEYRPFTEGEIIAFLGHRPGHDGIEFYNEFQAKLPKYGHAGPESTPGVTRRRIRPLGDLDELKAKAIQQAILEADASNVPKDMIRDIIGKLREMEQAEEYERTERIRRNRVPQPEPLDFGGQSRP